MAVFRHPVLGDLGHVVLGKRRTGKIAAGPATGNRPGAPGAWLRGHVVAGRGGTHFRAVPPSPSLPDEVRALWRRPEVQGYVDALAALDSGDAPMQSFVGFNVTRDRLLNAKVNHHHFRRLDDATLAPLVPVRTVFDRFYPKWAPTDERTLRSTGAAFVIKVKASGPPTYQFHFRFPFGAEDFAELGVAEQEFDLTNYKSWPGISFEYTGDEVLRKLYYYVGRPEEKDVIARQFGEPACREAKLLEYTQTDRARKVILWFMDPGKDAAYVRSLNWPILDELVELMAGFGCIPMFPGVYEGGETRALYFFRGGSEPTNPAWWDLPENRQIRTFDSIPELRRIAPGG